jgi:hypothetical protein
MMVNVRNLKFAVCLKGKNPVYPPVPPLIVDLGVSVLPEIMWLNAHVHQVYLLEIPMEMVVNKSIV